MNDALHVLLAEDSPSDAKLVLSALRALERPIESRRVESAADMRAALAEGVYGLVLSDFNMPGFTGFDALAITRSLHGDVPFIIVSGTIGEDVAVDAMRAGANDYVFKDRLSRLAPAVERELDEREVRRALRDAEERRRAIDARYRRVMETSSFGVWEIDVDGVTTFVNARMAALLGHEASAIVGRTPGDFLDLAGKRGFAERQAQRRDRAGAQVEMTFVRRDGSPLPVLMESSPMFDDHDAYEGSVGLIADLSALRRAEAALGKSEEQLRQAQKMEAVGRLAGGIAHDFNNLLSVVLTYSSILASDLEPGDPMREDLLEIEKAGNRAAELTRQLLTFSRQEVVEPKNLDVNDVLAGVEKMLRRILGEDVALVFVRSAERCRVHADRGHLEQVVMNLVVNARDAMPKGGAIGVETRNVVLAAEPRTAELGVAPGPYVVLAVSDDGIGMDAATRARIFEPFFTTKPRGKGTGLGLSTVFGIVQQCKGGVSVHSTPGRGTTFEIYLPRIDGALQGESPSQAPITLSGSETILVVDDEQAIRAVAAGILRRRGYRVIEARDAEEALLLCESLRAKLDLIITDVVMPETSGPELAKRLIERRPGTKVLCMSGYTDDAVVNHGALDAGVAFLQKPITPEKLARKVRAVLDGA
ncbi:MAG TPA: response regulator [Byssovorax sp.]|jgi:hypothetical protein